MTEEPKGSRRCFPRPSSFPQGALPRLLESLSIEHLTTPTPTRGQDLCHWSHSEFSIWQAPSWAVGPQLQDLVCGLGTLSFSQEGPEICH